jgi:hypothetical protein
MAKADPKPQRGGRQRHSAALGPNSEIGRKLKQYYDDLVTEEVPERFTNSAAQLEDKRAGRFRTERRRMSAGRLQARPAGRHSQPSCLCGVAVAKCRSCRRSGAGNAGQGVGQAVLLPAGHQSEGLAVHNPAQRILFADAQARTRGAGQRRRRSPDESPCIRPSMARSISTISARLWRTAGGPARGDHPDRRFRLLLRGSGNICDCAVGTIKSRVSRARSHLQEVLNVSGEGDFGPDSIAAQVMGSNAA